MKLAVPLSTKTKALLIAGLMVPIWQYFSSARHEAELIAKAAPTKKIDLMAQPEPKPQPQVIASAAEPDVTVASMSVPQPASPPLAIQETLPSEVPVSQAILMPVETALKMTPVAQLPPALPFSLPLAPALRSLNESGDKILYVNVEGKYSLRFQLSSEFKSFRHESRSVNLQNTADLFDRSSKMSSSFIDYRHEDWMLVSVEGECTSVVSAEILSIRKTLQEGDCYLGKLTDLRVLRGQSRAPASQAGTRMYLADKKKP